MTSRPWMPFYFGDYLADTRHLTTIQHGAYLLLIAHYWQRGKLPTDDPQLARITGLTLTQWKKMRPVLAVFFLDGWKHKRIEFELTECARISDAGRRGGQASAAARRLAKIQQNQYPESTTVQRPFNDPSNDSSTIGQPLQLQLQPQKEEEAASEIVLQETFPPAPIESPNGHPTKYAFECGIIRLTTKDLEAWKSAYQYIDVPAELTGSADWALRQPNWFTAISGLLNKRNREQKTKIDLAKSPSTKPKWSSGKEGVV